MSMGYVMPGVSPTDLLDVVQNDDGILVLKRPDGFEIVYTNPDIATYSLHKRVGLSRILKIAPDDVSQGDNTARIVLMQTDDQDNCWFWANGVSVSQPEVVLDRIVELFDSVGIDVRWLSEDDDGYWDIGSSED